ncbi:MAG TPA: 2'-5' RNA ligase family protein [Symbiobacteriaceae bacterium]|nr:2'-5' RNA ligase family protein [Symbiobacteriaceae bacterium]
MKPLYAVVSLLDAPSYGLVEQLWSELRQRCGIAGIYKTPFPHFSYHVAAEYDMNRLESRLRTLARRMAPFRVCTSGLGIFTGASPVVYVPVVRSPQLCRVHQQLWPALGKLSAGALDYYAPERWLPHITLGHGDISPETLPDVVRELARRDFHWTIEVDNFAVISSSGTAEGLHLRVPLG